uniref:Uncharacterized protein n=1 Tax=Mustela putorius furo TaxID=9669 RepID=M3YJ09_MUSPF
MPTLSSHGLSAASPTRASNLREPSPCLLVLVAFCPAAPQRRPCPPSLSSQRCLCTPSCRWHLKECIDHQHLSQNFC